MKLRNLILACCAAWPGQPWLAADDATDAALALALAKAGLKATLPPCDSQASIAQQQATTSAASSETYARSAPALLLFTSPSNCPPCYLVERDCLTDWRVTAALGRFRFLKMGPMVAPSYQVNSWPTLWYESHGRAWQYPCPTDPQAMADALNGIADRMEQPARPAAARP